MVLPRLIIMDGIDFSFTKGLSVDKIDIDILSGRGYLDNLELDEQFMSDVLELPPWMYFTKILCSKIRLKVSYLLFVRFDAILKLEIPN